MDKNQSRDDCFLARTARASSLTPTSSVPTMEESTTKNAKSIDDLIESLNNTTETPKSSSRKKYEDNSFHMRLVMFIFLIRSSSSSGKHSSKKSTATKELEDLMASLSNFKLPSQVSFVVIEEFLWSIG